MQKIAPRSKQQLEASINLDGIATNAPSDDWSGGVPKQPEYRNPKLLEAVRQLPCVHCGIVGFTQAAHSNQSRHGKCGFKRKASDAAIMALCGGVGSNLCHEALDNGKKYTKIQRRELTDEFINRTYLALSAYGHVKGLSFALHYIMRNSNGSTQEVADDFIKQMESGKVIVL